MSLLDIFRKPAPLNDFGFFRLTWDNNHSVSGGSVHLGTYTELRETLSALKRCDWFTKDIGIFYGHSMESDLREILDRHIDQMEHKGNADHEVGSPNDVHYFIPPCHSLGYSIEAGINGYSLEVLEMLKTRLDVIKRNGRVVAANECHMGRQEHYGSMHIV